MAKRKQPDRLEPGHHVIKYYGFEVLPNGDIQIAPALSDTMERIMAREHGLRALIDATNDYVSREFTRTKSETSKWWKQVAEETGIKLDDAWSFDASKQTLIKPRPKDDAAGQS